ncbi:hypothetical protein B0H63DRAFT_557143 [Podospora didyma]|uniref:Uncharacterized protein n=1 Tax=Podospora didyma TaxID=330526 RepID=A0AAE0NYT8_9PEZI|nr:hypothetical protein B0H63DRAFT_557143 [Podospora didyma]
MAGFGDQTEEEVLGDAIDELGYIYSMKIVDVMGQPYDNTSGPGSKDSGSLFQRLILNQRPTDFLSRKLKKNPNYLSCVLLLPSILIVLCVCLAVAATVITSASAFTHPCRFPYDNCGWVLANGYYGMTGYTYAELQAAANTTDGSKIYDALFSCDTATGDISYIRWCGGAGKCETCIVPNDNCRS